MLALKILHATHQTIDNAKFVTVGLVPYSDKKKCSLKLIYGQSKEDT